MNCVGIYLIIVWILKRSTASRFPGKFEMFLNGDGVRWSWYWEPIDISRLQNVIAGIMLLKWYFYGWLKSNIFSKQSIQRNEIHLLKLWIAYLYCRLDIHNLKFLRHFNTFSTFEVSVGKAWVFDVNFCFFFRLTPVF